MKKLTDNQIKEIKRLYNTRCKTHQKYSKTNKYTAYLLGKIFHVNKETIRYYIDPKIKQERKIYLRKYMGQRYKNDPAFYKIHKQRCTDYNKRLYDIGKTWQQTHRKESQTYQKRYRQLHKVKAC